MTIRINQITIDFTLEQEKTGADLTSSLQAWAEGQNLTILGILADGRALEPDDTALLTSFQEIEVEAIPVGERDIARAALINRFFGLLAQGSMTGDTGLITELQGEYPAVREALFPLMTPLARRLEDPLRVLEGPWSDASALGAAASRIAREAEARHRELQDPDQALARTLDDLNRAAGALAELGLLFQKGRDRDAFDQILGLFTLLEDGERQVELHLKNRNKGAAAWAAFQEELQPFLKETKGALTSGDYVLLTDLLEYEVTPRLTRLKALFPEISNLDPASDVI